MFMQMYCSRWSVLIIGVAVIQSSPFSFYYFFVNVGPVKPHLAVASILMNLIGMHLSLPTGLLNGSTVSEYSAKGLRSSCSEFLSFSVLTHDCFLKLRFLHEIGNCMLKWMFISCTRFCGSFHRPSRWISRSCLYNPISLLSC